MTKMKFLGPIGDIERTLHAESTGVPRNGYAARIACWLGFALVATLHPASALAQTTVYREGFENGTGAAVVRLPNYTAAIPFGGSPYTADAWWLNFGECNGLLVRYEGATVGTAPAFGTDCPNGAAAQNNVRRMADVLGQVNAGIVGSTNVAAPVNGSTTTTRNNHALTAWTAGNGSTAFDNQRQFETSPITLPISGNRYFTTRVDIAEVSCDASGGVNNSRLRFYFVNAANTEIPFNTAAIRTCTDSRATYYTSPSNASFPVTGGGNEPWGSGGVSARAGRFTSDGVIKYSGGSGSVRVRLRNEVGSSGGNDAAIDNIELIDVTPTLSKSFSSAAVQAGGAVQVIFTVTNTSDNLAKPGWQFTDNLSAGLTLANTTVGGTCSNFANTATPAELVGSAGATSFTIRGSLPAQPNCTVIVNLNVGSGVTASTLQNCGSNIASPDFVTPPGTGVCSTLAVTRPVNLTKVWQGATAGNSVGLTISGPGVSSAAPGISTAPSTTTAATAQGQHGTIVTVTEAFTTGSASVYASAIVCVRASDAVAVTLSGSGLSRTFTMPNDSGVNCTFTNSRLPILRLQKALPLGRFVAADQFDLSISGTGGPANVTTAGAGTTATGLATLNPGAIGAAYTFTETAAAGANLANYASTYACTNALVGGQAPGGSATTFNLTAAAGDDLTCTFTNTRNPISDLVITKTNTPGAGPSDQAADTVTRGATTIYTIVVTNNGPDTVTGAVLSDPAAGRSGLTCTAPPTCTGSACPGVLTLAGLEAGVALGALANGATVTITLVCSVN